MLHGLVVYRVYMNYTVVYENRFLDVVYFDRFRCVILFLKSGGSATVAYRGGVVIQGRYIIKRLLHTVTYQISQFIPPR